MTETRRAGILTGGGDVPGLNSVIKSVVYSMTAMGYEVLGIRKGWQGLTHFRPGAAAKGSFDAEYILPLTRTNTIAIDRTGGTMLHTSRVNPPKMRQKMLPPDVSAEQLRTLQVSDGVYDFTPVVLNHLKALGIDCLIVVGGDDTLSFASRLHERGVRVIGIPKTMDNDVQGTEYCIGFSTAITRAKELITRLRTTIGSHERIGVIRVFGRDAGFTAFYAAYVTGGRCVIPEVKFKLEHLLDLLAEDKRNNPSAYSFVIASEGALWEGQELSEYGEADAYGHRKKVNIGEAIAEEIQKRLKNETIVNDLTYDLRAGEPDVVDQIVATTFGNIAADLIRQGTYGRLVAIQEGRYTHAALPDPKLSARKLDVANLYDAKRYRPNYSGKLGLPMLLTHVPGVSSK